MKKLIFLTMMFSLMMVLSSSVSAQKAMGSMTFLIGDGAGTPAAGQILEMGIHTRKNNEPNAPAGTKYIAFKFLQGGKQTTGGLMQLTPAQAKEFAGLSPEQRKITKVEKPLPIRKFDTLKVTLFDNNFAFIEVEVLESGKKSLGKMKIHLKK